MAARNETFIARCCWRWSCCVVGWKDKAIKGKMGLLNYEMMGWLVGGGGGGMGVRKLKIHQNVGFWRWFEWA
jgi:hypothetical protein